MIIAEDQKMQSHRQKDKHKGFVILEKSKQITWKQHTHKSNI